jgi:alpha(1,3/1,4) fucosyltransferase
MTKQMIEQASNKVNTKQKRNEIFIDPSYSVYNNDNLFNLADLTLNRDNQLLPLHRLRERLNSQGENIHTADYLFQSGSRVKQGDYYSLGLLDKYHKISQEGLARLVAFVIMEPPVVAPHLYAALPDLTAAFEHVYVHNVDGDGYSLNGVKRENLRKLYWPIPYDKVLEPFWSQNDRVKKVVVINGNHNPRFRLCEQYSTRIEAMVELSKFGVVDLYGQGWNKWWSREALWLSYWCNRSKLMSIYKGACASKFEVLQRYEFCLCFENMAMNGYITEKIFDCLYAGTIPLYLGAPDISKYIPSSVYIDCSKFSSWSAMWKEVSTMSNSQIQTIREAGRLFLASDKVKPFFNSIENIVCEES